MANEPVSAPKHVTFEGLKFLPRFDYGDQAQVAEITGTGQGTMLGTGFVKLIDAAIPWTIKYDEVVLVLEGTFTVETRAETIKAEPMDCIWLPKGSELIYRAKKALVFYVIHPANWAERRP